MPNPPGQAAEWEHLDQDEEIARAEQEAEVVAEQARLHIPLGGTVLPEVYMRNARLDSASGAGGGLSPEFALGFRD